MRSRAVVFVVDDDKEIRNTMAWLLRRAEFEVECCESPTAVLGAAQPCIPGCFLIDLQLPGATGFEVQLQLREKGCFQPFIFVSGYGDAAHVVEAMHQGAFDYIQKPFRHERLLDAVERAVARDIVERTKRDERASIGSRMDSLTARECEVLELVVAGQPSKCIARQLGIAMKTVEVHRTNIMKKMGVRSVAPLTSLVTKFLLNSQ